MIEGLASPKSTNGSEVGPCLFRDVGQTIPYHIEGHCEVVSLRQTTLVGRVLWNY